MRRCTTHALYRSKLWQQGHCQRPQNANLDYRDVPRVIKTKFPAPVMVFGMVSSEGHIMPPHIFEVGLKVNTKVYLDVLKSVAIPWCNQVARGREWVWVRTRRRSTSPKKSRLGFRRSATTLYPSLTAPSSPDLNPLNYFVCSYVENITNMTSHNTKASLIAAIRWVFAELSPALVEKASCQFRIRIEVGIEAEGGYMDISSTTFIKLAELIFSIKVLK